MCFAIVINLGQIILGIMLPLKGEGTRSAPLQEAAECGQVHSGDSQGSSYRRSMEWLFLLSVMKCYKQTNEAFTLLRLRKFSIHKCSVYPDWFLVVNVGYAGLEREPAVCMVIAPG